MIDEPKKTQAEPASFTEEQYAAFARTVLDCESLSNFRRITGRMDQKRMVEELGKPTCDAMWAEFQKRNPDDR